MTELRDQPPPPGYWPNTPNQFREATVDDCTWYAGEFAFQSASNTHISMHPVKDLREKSTDTEGGTPILVMLRDTAKLWPAEQDVSWHYGAFSKAQLKTALRSGAVLVVGGDYQNLPLHYRRWTANDKFAHAIALKFLLEDGRTRMYDPLGGGPARIPYDGEWIPFDDIFGDDTDFCWRTSLGQYLCGIVYNGNEERMEKMYLDPARPVTRQARIANGTKVFARPDERSETLRTYWGAEKWRWLFGSAGNGWRITVYLDEDGETWVKGYVPVNSIIEVKNAPVETPPPPTPCEDVEPYKTTIASLTTTNDTLRAEIERLDDIITEVREICERA